MKIAKMLRPTSALILLSALAVGQICQPPGLLTGMQVIPVPYTPGQSFGPLQPIQNPLLEQDQRRYAQAYWEMVDACGQPTPLAISFQPQSPNWNNTTFPSTSLPSDADPFGVGRILFREIFRHQLQLNPLAGPLFDIEQLIQLDPNVQLTWRWWTLTHQLVTAVWLDPQAHQHHIEALLESFTSNFEWQSRGVPFYDLGLTILVSDNTKKKKGAAVAPPVPVPLGNLPAAIQGYDAIIRARATKLANIAGLYDADGNWWFQHVGFDCDDFADAIGTYITKGTPGMTATTVRVTWTDSNGQGQSHRVTKISCGGYYWLVDAQTGAVDGPHAAGVKVDATNVVGGYDIDNTKPITTEDDGRALGSRPGLREPPAWFNDPAQRARFQQITGFDPACFF